MQIKHLVNGEWVEVRQNKLAEAFDHAKARGSQFDKDLYKVATNVQGHVVQATPVTKTDLTNYGLLDTNAVAPLYSDNTTYSTGEFCIYEGKLYKALQNVDHEEFNPSKWEESNILTATVGGGTVITGEADWNAQQGDLGYIKNKPDIPEGLPSVSVEDNGKTLVVDDGEWTIGSGGGGGGGGVSLVNYDDYIVATDGTKAVLGDSIYVTIDGQVENISFYDEIPMVADISLGSPVIYKTDEGEYKLMNYKVDTTEYGAAEVVPLQSGFYLNNDITDCIMLVDMESGNNFAIIFPPTATFTYNLGH